MSPNKEKIPTLREALEEADAALNCCIRYFLGTGPQPEPDELARSTIIIQKALQSKEKTT